MKNKKKCEFCGKYKTIEQLGTVSCKECESDYKSGVSKWYLLALSVCGIVLLNIYETSTISFIFGLVFGVMVGLLLNNRSKDNMNN